MQRFAGLCVLFCLASAAAQAGPIFTDPFGAGAPDVIGEAQLYDIRSVEFGAFGLGEVSLHVRMNYNGGDAARAEFNVPGTSFEGVPLGVGDLLLEGRSHLWAIPLSGTTPIGGGGAYLTAAGAVPAGAVARPITPGSVYQVARFLSAEDVLGIAPADDFRAGEFVWGDITVESYTNPGVTIATALGGGEIDVQVIVLAEAPFFDDIADGFRLHLASTTCACDVLDGLYAPAGVPEPGAAALLAIALLLGARARGVFPAFASR